MPTIGDFTMCRSRSARHRPQLRARRLLARRRRARLACGAGAMRRDLAEQRRMARRRGAAEAFFSRMRKPCALVFEFLQPVFLHEREQALRLRRGPRLRTCDTCDCASGISIFSPFIVLENPVEAVVKILGALGRDHHIIFDANTAKPFDVDARLDGHDHALLRVRFPRPCPAAASRALPVPSRARCCA